MKMNKKIIKKLKNVIFEVNNNGVIKKNRHSLEHVLLNNVEEY